MRNYINQIFPVILAVMFFCFTAFGQTVVPTPPPLSIDDDVVKISTALIQIDVSVTDKKGNPVKDLKPEEVEIYENGKRQTITNFNFITGENQTTIETPNKENQTNIPLPPPQIRPEQVRRTIALVVDDLTLSFESIHNVRRALKKFVDEQMRDGDLVAIIRTGAGIGALQQFTTDKRQLYAAIEKIRWNPLGNGGISAFAPIESNGIEAASDIEESEDDGADPADASGASPNDAASFRESVFAAGTLGAVNYIVRGMEELPGRKSVMLFSDGFSIFNEDGSSGRVLDALQRLTDLANRASVVIYTMDARGLQTLGITAADNVSGKSAEQIESALSERRDKNFNTQEGLIYLAKQTGGFAIRNNNDLSGGVRQMLNDQSYYLVGYEPEDGAFDPAKRKFNKIEVKVKRDGVNVRYRSGFFNVSDEQIAEKPVDMTEAQKILGALTSPFAANDIALSLNAVFGNDEKTGSFIRSFLHIEGKNIEFTDEPDGKKKAVFDILAMEFGDNGVPVDEISKTFTANVSEQQMLDIKKRGIVYDFIFPVKRAGAYQLRVALHDKGSGKVGSANQFLEVPNIKKNRLVLSGIVLENIPFETWQQLNAGQKVSRNSDPFGDTALRQFKRGTVLNYGLTALNPKLDDGGKPNLTTQIRLYRDGKVYFTGNAQAFKTDTQTNMQKVQYGGSLSLGTKMPTGNYILQIIVTDNLAKKKRQIATQFVQFEIVE